MPLVLHVDGERWRSQARSLISQTPDVIVPVTKGNGYGFGKSTLAAEAAKLGTDTLAVGEYEEISDVAGAFAGDLLVLSPWRPWVGIPDMADDAADGDAGIAHRIIHTVSRMDDLRTLASSGARPRVVLELLTSMRRHGIDPGEITTALGLVRDVQFEGIALHLPLAGDHTDEVRALAGQAISAAKSAGVEMPAIWLSHTAPHVAERLAGELGLAIRVRLGTTLWLGDRSLVQAKSTVLDLHTVQRGDRFGYRQRRARRTGTIAIVSGGTAHGIALEAPSPAVSIRQRAVSLAKGGLEATGRALSPFQVSGKHCWFAEPPHMQCSMIWLPSAGPVPAVGDELDVDVRFTTTSFDDVRFAPA